MIDYRKFSIFVVCVLSFVLIAQSATAQNMRVVRVHSGSSFDVQRADGRGPVKTVHLWGVEAPLRGQQYWQESRDYTARLLRRPFRMVEVAQLHTIPQVMVQAQDDRGRFYNFNHRLLADGKVWWNRFRYETERDLERLEEAARINRRGLWRAEAPIAPWQWREGQRPQR
ncbi:MAG: thermonuclease family protein [Fimbriimonadaceae bacterium]